MVDLDRFDGRILQCLSRKARIPNVELARVVGLSPSACLRRVQELERNGTIKGYRAVLDRRAAGIGFVAYVAVGLSDHSRAAQKAFERAVASAPEVLECHNITGAFEYMLRVEAVDLAAYKAFHTDVLGAIPKVNAMTTYVVIDSPKDERA